ncbi:hypothetical protein [Paracoccus zhouxuedongae]|uniref:hypothetical protein n=1 Tax=Paracoccus sp. p4-l81 TaxID=3342806 RepID=UPI0035BBC96E
MPWPAHWVRVSAGRLMVGTKYEFRTEEPDYFLNTIKQTESLAKLRELYPASRSSLIEAMSQLGYDFLALVERQILSGMSNAELAKVHAVDQKWIAEVRRKRGLPRIVGRPSNQVADSVLIAAYARHENYVGAARELGLDPRTFGNRYRAARMRCKTS